jgi:hypothetical protein
MDLGTGKYNEHMFKIIIFIKKLSWIRQAAFFCSGPKFLFSDDLTDWPEGSIRKYLNFALPIGHLAQSVQSIPT